MRLLAIIASNGATSLVSLLITILVARQDGPTALGVFGISFAVLSLARLFSREVGINRALSSPDDSVERQAAYTRALLVAVAVSFPMIVVGIVIVQPIVIITGFVVPGYTAYNFLRLLTMTDGKITRGLLADTILLVSVGLASLGVLYFDGSSLIVLASWAIGLIIGCVLLQRELQLSISISARAARSSYTGASFGIQSLFGSGAVHFSTFILASIFGPVLVGALRGASTVLGPVNLVTSSVGTVAIRQIAAASAVSRPRTMLGWFGISSGVALVGASGIVVAMHYFGSTLMGDSWGVVQPLIIWVSLDAVIVATETAARAAHRVDKRDVAAWKVNIGAGVMRLLLLPVGGWWYGAVGVAMASALVSLTTGILWWLSYYSYRRKLRVHTKAAGGSNFQQVQSNKGRHS